MVPRLDGLQGGDEVVHASVNVSWGAAASDGAAGGKEGAEGRGLLGGGGAQTSLRDPHRA